MSADARIGHGVTDNQSRRRFELDVGGQVAFGSKRLPDALNASGQVPSELSGAPGRYIQGVFRCGGHPERRL